MTPLLATEGLKVEFVHRGVVANRPLRGIDLEVRPGEVVGIVGETGCGKTLTGLSILGLVPAGARVSGRILFEGRDLLAAPERELRQVRGRRISMVFQNPATAFNPVFPVGWQLERVVRRHLPLTRAQAREHVAGHLRSVGLSEVEWVARAYPHQLSGGMLQRAMIAMALLCRPRLLIADEPTSALDVTIAQQILRLLLELQATHGFSVLFITHNLNLVRDLCDRVAVLYAGRVVELGATAELFGAPAHPYTRGLLGALPGARGHGSPLVAIPGSVPMNLSVVRGCAFADRCPKVTGRCRVEDPPLAPAALAGNGHRTACLLEARP